MSKILNDDSKMTKNISSPFLSY